MGIESLTEQGIKTAFKAYTDTLTPDNAVTYRCFFLDDEVDSGEEFEQKEYPLVQITASPNTPSGYLSPFRDIPVEIKWATHKNFDLRNRLLVAMYDACRAILDTATTILVTGYGVTGIIIGEGQSEAEDNEQRITLNITVKICGA